jgi:hypothetical protein
MSMLRSVGFVALAVWNVAQAGDLPPCGQLPRPDLPVVDVVDAAAPFGIHDQSDIDLALAMCGNGCNLHFLAETYHDVALDIGPFADGFAMFGEGQASTVLRAPLYGISGPWDYMIDIRSDAPDGMIVQELTLDGRRDEQNPPRSADCESGYANYIRRTYAIHAGTPVVREGGVLRCLEIRNFLQMGILLSAVDRWTVSDNWIHDIGCHDFDQFCGPQWEEWGCIEPDNVPHRRVNGYGIYLATDSRNVVVSNNTVEGMSKMAIQVENILAGGCGTPRYATDNLVLGNTVRQSADGIVVNGGCRTIIEDSLVEGMLATGNESLETGAGIVCAAGGCDGMELRRNVSRNNQSSGYQIRGPGNVLFDSNESYDNCGGTLANVGDLEIRNGAGATVTNHLSFGSESCFAGAHISSYADARVTNSSFSSGSLFGLRIHMSRDVEIDRVTVEASSSSVIGTSLGTDLERVFVQANVDMIGFDQEVDFNAGMLDDGDSVAYCRLESVPPTPQCCKDLPGYEQSCPTTLGVPALNLAKAVPSGSDVRLTWASLPAAEAYDVVRGNLRILREAGDLANAAQNCISDNATPTELTVLNGPGLVDGFWFLVRGVTLATTGSWDSGSASQPDSRNPGIANSPADCP